MRNILIAPLVALALSACASTVEEREVWRDTGVILAITAVDVIKDIGLGPDDLDPQVLKIVNGACLLFRAGGPLMVLVINDKVAAHNAGVLEDEQTELTNVAEYMATLDAACVVIEAILTPLVEEPAGPV